MKITIAGFGTIGQYLEKVFGQKHEVVVYDKPKRLGTNVDLRETDFVLICVPTPLLADGLIDTSMVEDVVMLAEPRTGIICESTLPIGSTDRIISTYGKQLVYVPEWAGESPDHPFRDPARRDFFIYGGYEPLASAVRDLFRSVYPASARHDIVAPMTAETVKYAENAFLALKVAFSNEIFDLCERLGIRYDDVRNLWTQDWRIGSSHTIVTPERGYGGKCLPKDVAALCMTARELGLQLEIMEAAQRSNARRRQVPD